MLHAVHPLHFHQPVLLPSLSQLHHIGWVKQIFKNNFQKLAYYKKWEKYQNFIHSEIILKISYNLQLLRYFEKNIRTFHIISPAITTFFINN